MFRVSQFMQEIADPTPIGPKRNPPGPVVIWNLIRRCNLACKHCYSVSANRDFPGELATKEVFSVMDDLKAFRVPVLILSGGEPLLRPDIYDIAWRAKDDGVLRRPLHQRDPHRRQEHRQSSPRSVSTTSESASTAAARPTTSSDAAPAPSTPRCARCGSAATLGVKVGVRFTLTSDNFADLPWLLAMIEREGIDKFYLSHLNYAGRGNVNRKVDAQLAMTREAMDLLFDVCWDCQSRGAHKEFVTGNNDADGVYLLHWVRRRFPQDEAHIRAKLEQWGGNASGVNVANIDNLGNVHPDTYWWDYSLGNVRERPFSEIWRDVSDPIMAGLKASPRASRVGAASVRTSRSAAATPEPALDN